MRIGLVSPYSFDVPGGVQLHVRDLAEWLIAHGHYVEVLAPADPDTELPPYVVSAGSALPVPYNGSVARLTFGPVTAGRVSRWLDEGRFDVLHVHEPISPSVSMLAMWSAQIPMVATFHTSNTKSRALLAVGPMLQPGLEKVMGRITVSAEARRFVRDHIGGDAVIIPNGVYVDQFAGAAPNPQWEGTTDRPTLAFLGRLEEPRKGLQVLLDAMPRLLQQHPGLRLLVAGPGDPTVVIEGRPAHVQQACEFLGPISDEQKRSFLRSVDLYIAPNTGGESFGIILVEAMSAGAAVVASDIAAFRAVLDDGWAGALFANEQSGELADVVLDLLAHPSDRAQLAAQGSRRARRFDWATVAADVFSVYETVCAAAPMARPAQTEARSIRRWRRSS